MYFFAFILSFILFTSFIFSYGIFFKKVFFKNSEISFGEIGIFGFVLLYFISLIFHFIIPLSNLLILGLWIFAAINIYINSKELFIIIEKKISFLFLFFFFFLISLTTSLHDDVNLYQMQIVNYMQNFKIIFGISSLNDYLGYGHSFYEIMALFKVPFYGNNFIFLVPVIFSFFFITFLFQKIKEKESKFIYSFAIIILILFFLKFTRSKEYGTDIVVFCSIAILQVYFLDFILSKKFLNFYKFIIIFSFAIFSKLYAAYAIIYLVVFIYYFIRNFKNEKLKYPIIVFLFLFCFLSITKNLINTGCVFYPAYQTCFDNKKYIPWSLTKDIAKDRHEMLRASSRGWKAYIRTTDGKKIVTAKDYLEISKYNYPKYLTKDPDFERFIILISIIFIVSLIFIFDNHTKIKNNQKSLILSSNKNFLILLCLSFVPVFLWFFNSPHMRYGGYNYLALFGSIIASNFLNVDNFSKNKIKILIILSIIFCFSKNSKRIYKEYNSSKEFPKIVFDKIDYNYFYKNNVKIFYPKKGLYCGNTKQICTSDKNLIYDIYKKYGYIFIMPDKVSLKKFIFETSIFENYLLNDIKKK